MTLPELERLMRRRSGVVEVRISLNDWDALTDAARDAAGRKFVNGIPVYAWTRQDQELLPEQTLVEFRDTGGNVWYDDGKPEVSVWERLLVGDPEIPSSPA